MSDQELEMMDEDIITLTLDDDTEVPCVVLGIFEANGKEYIALLPTEGEDADNGQVYLYGFSEDEEGNPILANIEDDEEFEIASDAFDEMLDNMEFDEGFEEESDEE